MPTRLRINGTQIVHEIIGGEAVIVNLENGNYYSADGVGAEIWRQIGTGSSRAQIVDAIVASYEVDRATANAEVGDFLEQLRGEGIIELSDEVDGHEPRGGPETREPKLRYESPCLETYSDMQQMIALDPIHEVDATGWPKRES
jgi:hypothetical protein